MFVQEKEYQVWVAELKSYKDACDLWDNKKKISLMHSRQSGQWLQWLTRNKKKNRGAFMLQQKVEK